MIYYTYILSYPDGRTFYVGKGHDNRIKYHEWEARKGKRSHKCNTIRKIWADGGDVVKRIVFETSSEEDALLYEWVLINLIYGRENLTNVNEGGSGALGVRYDDEYKRRMSERLKGRVFPDEHRARLRAASTGRRHSDETRRKISTNQLGREISQAQREKQRAALKGRKRPPELMARISAATTKTWPGLIAPDGTEYRNIYSLRAFCTTHGLTQSAISKVVNGLRDHHKGWRKINETETNRETSNIQCNPLDCAS